MLILRCSTFLFAHHIPGSLSRTYNDICPIAALLAYLAAQGQQGSGPLFCFKDGRYLTRQRFVEHVGTALQQSGINPAHYSGHSFRISAATTAAAYGLEDSLIQTLGRWESTAFLRMHWDNSECTFNVNFR